MTNDGTQDPVPPPVLADPLAGLVTGSRYEPEPLRVRVTEPPKPDISAVREALASVLDEDSELDLRSIGPAADFFTDSAGETPAAPAEGAPVAQLPVSEVPAQAAGEPAPPPAEAPVPAPAPTRGPVTRVTPPSGIPAQRGGSMPAPAPQPADRGEETRAIRLPRGFMRRQPSAANSSSLGSVTVIVALLVVMGVLAIVFLASLIDTISAVFD